MNLKEAFRYQNKLHRLMDEAESILRWEKNVVKVENTLLLHKVNPDVQNETTTEPPCTEYADQITEIAVFLMFLLAEREKLSKAIREAKQRMDMDFDGEISLNVRRQEIAGILRQMSQIRSAEVLLPGAGVGYKFNAEGNQVSYCCDLKKVTTINFDRNKIRAFATGLSNTADSVSTELDKRTINTEVDYVPLFDVNDTFADIFRQHMDLGA